MIKEIVNKLIEIEYQDEKAEETQRPIYYQNRNLFTYELIAMALRHGYKAGIRIDPTEPEWPIAFIELPTGQISYHLKQHDVVWDDHTTEQKRLRILSFIALCYAG